MRCLAEVVSGQVAITLSIIREQRHRVWGSRKLEWLIFWGDKNFCSENLKRYQLRWLLASICLSASLKTKLFCETSSVFELDNIKNAAIQPDLLNFCTWQHQKRSNSARLPHFLSWQHQKLPHFLKLTTSKTKQFGEISFENGKLSAELTASYKCVLRFFDSTCLNYCACHDKWYWIVRNAAPVTQNHLSKPEDLMLQNATPLRKSAPGPPNSSDEHVSCTAPATENASLQILFKCPTPAIVFLKCDKTLTFCSLLTRCTIPCACHAKRHLNVASRHNGVHFLNISTSKSGPELVCFVRFDFEMCFAPQRLALFRHLNF